MSVAPDRPGCAYFIAGTDTGVGKTRITVALLAAARAQGLLAAGMKPVAAGAELREGRLTSADATQIAAASGQAMPYEELNPYCLLESISPHIAADRAKIAVDASLIATIAEKMRAAAQLLLIEGTGGWYTPISESASMADLARALGYPVILVVGLKLGCLNHARLSHEAILRGGCRVAGWVGTQIDPHFAAMKENLATLERLLGSAPLALLPYSSDPHNDVPRLRNALMRLLATQRHRDA